MMTRSLCLLVVLVPFSLILGCTEEPGTTINPTSADVIKPAAVTPAESSATSSTKKTDTTAEPKAEPKKVEELKPEPSKPEELKPETAEKPGDLLTRSCDPAPADDAEGVVLELVKFSEYSKRVVNKDAKLTMVDIWATFCAPCKENFPHVLEMQKKYGAKGLKVISLTIDDPTDAKVVGEARKFLNEKKATITNLILEESEDDRYGKLDLSVIPAVYLYDPAGKLIKRYTYDDPNDQFDYNQVETDVAGYLDGKPLPGKNKPK